MWLEAVLTLTVAILGSVDCVKISFNTAIYGEGTVNKTRLSFADCVHQCHALQGCTFVNYVRLMPLCQFITRNTSIVLNNRVGHVAVNLASGSFRYLAECKNDGVVDIIHFCPEGKKAEGTTVLGNMNFDGAKRVTRCIAPFTLDGLNGTTCTGDGTWSDHGKCVKFSTMRQPCQSNTGCIDKDSECRKGRCWCKLGLSHNPVNNSCVVPCPGKYGETFQILDDFGIPARNKYRMPNPSAAIDVCIRECLNTTVQGYVCKYIDISPDPDMCNFNEIPDNKAPPLSPYDGELFLQRDCMSSQ